jgi:uncharacterized protein (DUF433 family)
MVVFDRITFNPEIMGGKACIRGMRITVLLVVKMVHNNGMTTEEILAEYPDLETEDIQQALAYYYVELLGREGDPYEIEGCCSKYGLGNKFPRYAEFWAKYVYPNRRRGDSSKLRKSFPQELEDLFNAHYSVWFHLTIAYRQIARLENEPSEFGDPLLHLVSSADIAEQALVRALVIGCELDGRKLIQSLSEAEYMQRVCNYWKSKRGYRKDFERFASRYKPVTHHLHSASDVLKESTPQEFKEVRAAFNEIVNLVRPYRNLVAHNPPPIQWLVDGKLFLPKPEIEHLMKKYSTARYSSGDRHIEDFSPADKILSGLADQLVSGMNGYWAMLISTMEHIASSSEYGKKLAPLQTPESGIGTEQHPAADTRVNEGPDSTPNPRIPTGGTIESTDYPTRPSALASNGECLTFRRDDEPD